MQNRFLQFSLALFLVTGSLWFFADTIFWNQEQKDLIRHNTLSEFTVVLGASEHCQVEASLATLRSMELMGVHRWIVECENAVQGAE